MMDSRTYIFILGCGIMQIPALKIARDMGWYVAAADVNPDSPGRSLCDEFFLVDLKDSPGLIAAAQSMVQGKGPHGVFTAGTDFSESVAKVAQALKLPGHSVDAARCATDKILMRRKFREHGVPSPDFVELAVNDEVKKLARSIPSPWVVKPVDSMGARGVIKIDKIDALEDAVAAARKYSRSSRVLMETYVDGPEYSLDALIEDGKLIRCGLADRIIAYPPRFIEIGHTIPSSVSPESANMIWDVFEKGVKALGLKHGAAKGDVKFSHQGPVIGEIAARLSGGYMSGWTWPFASGVEATRGGLHLAVGRHVKDLRPTKNLVCAEKALIGIDGTVSQLGGRDKVMKLPGIREVFLRYAPGDSISFPANNVEKVANVLAVGKTAAEANRCATLALQNIILELDTKDSRTGRYLDSFDSFPPDCFVTDGFFDKLWGSCPPHPSLRTKPLRPEIVIPRDLPDSVDYTGRSMREILEFFENQNLIKTSIGSLCVECGQFTSDFWKALVRGGSIGLRWFLCESD